MIRAQRVQATLCYSSIIPHSIQPDGILIPPPRMSFSPTLLGCTKKSISASHHSHHSSQQPHLICLPSFIQQNQILIGLCSDKVTVNVPWHGNKWSWIQPPVQHAAKRAGQGEPSREVSGAPHKFGQPQRLQAGPGGLDPVAFPSSLALTPIYMHTARLHTNTHSHLQPPKLHTVIWLYNTIMAHCACQGTCLPLHKYTQGVHSHGC